MTVPASSLLSSTAAPVAIPGAALAAAVSGTQPGETADFAAHLAREVPALPSALLSAGPLLTAAPTIPASPADPALAAKAPADPGKVLPPTRQKSAAVPAALALAITQMPVGTSAAAGETPASAVKAAADQPDVDETALVLALASPALPQPAQAAALQSAKPVVPARSAQGVGSATLRAAERPSRTPARTQAPDAQTTQAAHPAVSAVASLVFEREISVEPAQQTASPAPAEPETAAQNTAHTLPSTFAALTGAPAPSRPAPRKAPAEADPALPAAHPAALPAPETAGALAPALPPVAAAPATTAPSAPQPISFDQLVESIARARDGMEPAGPVAVAMHHAEFGRVALRIEGDAAGLSVALASPDPAFAPAAAAAHAAAVIAEPARPASSEPRTETPGQSLTQNQNQTQGHGQQGHGQQGQQRQGAYTPAAQRPLANPAHSPASADERRGGIFA
jgi:hypothetical protein